MIFTTKQHGSSKPSMLILAVKTVCVELAAVKKKKGFLF